MTLSFLKILILDIGISLGDTVTDMLQGFSLIIDDGSLSFRISTMRYGIAIILASWLPVMIAIIHLGCSDKTGLSMQLTSIQGWLLIIFGIALFPLVPTFLYIYLLICPNSTPEEKGVYERTERRAHEVKSIAGAVEAPVQLIILLYLMCRGILTLPWQDVVSSSCLEDSLGRVACLPSIPMASMIFATFAIIKAMHEMNIYPILLGYSGTMNRFNKSIELFLLYLPFFLGNAGFRISSFCIMFVYLDNWAIIPIFLIWLINLVIFGIPFSTLPQTIFKVDSSTDFDEPGLVIQELDDSSSEPDMELTNALEWIPEDIGDKNAQPNTQNGSKNKENMESFFEFMVPTSNSGETHLIQENSSIFLNATAGLFFPSCHVHLAQPTNNVAYENNKEYEDYKVDKIRKWQNTAYKKQAYIVNPLIMVAIMVIFAFVTLFKFFNYNTNILDPFRFNIIMGLLIMFGLFGMVLAMGLEGESNEEEENSSISAKDVADSGKKLTSSTLTQRILCCRSLFCLLLVFLILCPVLLLCSLVLNQTDQKSFVFIINQNGDAEQGTRLNIMSAFPLISNADYGSGILRGKIESNCFIDEKSNFTGKILTINGSSPKCQVLLEEPDFYERAYAANATAIILLDNTPRPLWRVSSPFEYKPVGFTSLSSTLSGASYNSSSSLRLNIPFMLVRYSDWAKYDSYLQEKVNSVYVGKSNPNDINHSDLFECSNTTRILIGGKRRKGLFGSCKSGKQLEYDGRFLENICVKGACSRFGEKCPSSLFNSKRSMHVSLRCKIPDNTTLTFAISGTNTNLEPAQLTTSDVDSKADYCCRNANSDNSTFLEVLGEGCFDKWRDVERFHSSCIFSDWIPGVCEKEVRTVYRVCLVPDTSCLIKEYYSILCSVNIRLPLCLKSTSLCNQ